MILIYIGIALIALAVILFIYNLISPVKYIPPKTVSVSVSKEEKDDKKDVLYGDGGTRLLDKEEDRTRLLKEDKTRLLDNKDQTRKLK